MSVTASEVILAYLKLSRAMRRYPVDRRVFVLPPAVDRMLECAAENPNLSSRELCEILDLRPSSLSEFLSRAESDGLISREPDGKDRRVQRIALTGKGRETLEKLQAAREEDARKRTACLTEEEKVHFCALCNKLSDHIESLALDLPPEEEEPPRRDRKGPHRRPLFPGKGNPPPREDSAPSEEEEPCRPPLPPGGRYRC